MKEYFGLIYISLISNKIACIVFEKSDKHDLILKIFFP